ncbi:hypothetical protein ALC56_00544 [Trachymyrmex septentrionalis]|uniref:Uncharacterized protein n=1 Tax=Trachymyrmex septentrionalis TaxID=34720 RepID=A0A195FWN6_9HYME|nr:PREDICTED: uncharacterized protein LOC108747722 [Trachymyrmex septentrionalis]KYN45070.1 hypothetical protein ALC56_00544 [Trachymyrmex septentrionalis]
MEVLRREKELAERQLRLLQREVDLIRANQGGNSDSYNVRRGTKLIDVKDLIGEFDRNVMNYDVWEKQINFLVRKYSLDNLEIKAIICNKLRKENRKPEEIQRSCYNCNEERHCAFNCKRPKCEKS